MPMVEDWRLHTGQPFHTDTDPLPFTQPPISALNFFFFPSQSPTYRRLHPLPTNPYVPPPIASPMAAGNRPAQWVSDGNSKQRL